jgi:hypothetical protein
LITVTGPVWQKARSRHQEADRLVEELVGEDVGRRDLGEVHLGRSQGVDDLLNPTVDHIADGAVGTVAGQAKINLSGDREIGQLGRVGPERVVGCNRLDDQGVGLGRIGVEVDRRLLNDRDQLGQTGTECLQIVGADGQRLGVDREPGIIEGLEGQLATVLLDLILVDPDLGRGESLLGDVALGHEAGRRTVV